MNIKTIELIYLIYQENLKELTSKKIILDFFKSNPKEDLSFRVFLFFPIYFIFFGIFSS